MSNSVNPLFDPSTDNAPIDQGTQARLNAPLGGGQMSEADHAFVQKILELVDRKTIDLYKPSTLLNQSVYESLTPEEQGKADQNAMNMISKIRTIVDWERSSFDTNYQVVHMVEALRQDKERLESEKDIFII